MLYIQGLSRTQDSHDNEPFDPEDDDKTYYKGK